MSDPKEVKTPTNTDDPAREPSESAAEPETAFSWATGAGWANAPWAPPVTNHDDKEQSSHGTT